MMQRKYRLALLVIILAIVGIGSALWAQQSFSPNSKKPLSNPPFQVKEPDLLEPDDAFKSKVSVAGPNKLVIDVTPANGYYLYKDKIHVRVKNAPDASVGAIHYPPSETKIDQTFGKTEVYRKSAKICVDLDRVPKSKKVTVVTTYQGCNEKVGVCYSPIEKSIDVVLP